MDNIQIDPKDKMVWNWFDWLTIWTTDCGFFVHGIETYIFEQTGAIYAPTDETLSPK